MSECALFDCKPAWAQTALKLKWIYHLDVAPVVTLLLETFVHCLSANRLTESLIKCHQEHAGSANQQVEHLRVRIHVSEKHISNSILTKERDVNHPNTRSEMAEGVFSQLIRLTKDAENM